MGQSGSSPSNQNTLTKSQKKVEKAIGAQILGNVGQGATPYSGQQVADLDPAYQGIYQNLLNYDPSNLNSQIQDELSQLLNADVSYDVKTGAPTIAPTKVNRSPFTTGPRLSPDATQDYFQKSVAAPLMRTFEQTTVPAINAAYAGQGATFSTRRGQAQERALGDVNTNLAAQLSQAVREDQLTQFNADAAAAQQQNQLNYGYDTTQAGIDSQTAQGNANLSASADSWQQQLMAQLSQNAVQVRQQAVAQGQQVSGLPLTQAAAQQQLLAIYQQQQQQQATAKYNEFLRTSRENDPWTQLGLAYLGGNYTTPYMQQSSSPLGQYGAIAGGVIGGIGGTFVAPGAGTLAGASAGIAIGGGVGGLAGGTASSTDASGGIANGASGWQKYYSTR